MECVKEKVRKFLEQYIRNKDFEDDDNIFKLGLIGSLFAMQLIMFIEKEFNIKVENDDLDLDNFSSLNAINEFINKKISK